MTGGGRRPRLLQVIRNYPPAVRMGGSQRAMSELAGALAAVADVRVVTTTFGGKVAPALPPGVERRADGVEVRRFGGGADGRRLTPELVRHLRTSVGWADAVHLGDLRTSLDVVVAASAGRGLRIGLSPWGSAGASTGARALRRRAWDHSIGRIVYRRTSVAFAQTESERRDLALLPSLRAHLELVPLSVPAATLPARPPRNERGPLRVLTVARLHPLKNVEVLVDAVARTDDCHLDIVGGDEGSEASLRSRIAELRIADRVHLHGPVYGNGLWPFHQAADVFALVPAYNEGTSLASLDAAASGCPPIVTEGADLPFLVDGRDGWRVPPTTDGVARALADARAAKVSGTLAAMRGAARVMVEQHHTLEAVATRYLDHLLGVRCP